ncbi:unnamed protein product, partial [Ectocarpus sp. 12 AP-2014]
MAFFEKKRLQKKQSGGGRSGNESAVAGSPMKVKEAEEKKEDEAESNSLPRNWPRQALPRQEGAVEAKPGEEYDALAAAVVAPADHAKGPAHADSQLSRTPRELGSTGGDAWQTREAILVTPPRGNGGGSAAFSPPLCPSPFVAARRPNPFAEPKPAAGGGESGKAGGRAARTVVVEPSNSWCATTGAVAHAVVPFEHASPPMWKPFRPIVGPDAAAAVAGGALRAGAKELKVPHSTTLEPPSLGPDYAPGGGDVARPAVDAPACSLGKGNTDAVGEEDAAETCECPLGKGRADVVGTSNGVIGKGGGATAAGWAGARRTEERQRLRKEQLDLVKQSDKTPMTLPLMDGSTHAPEADDFSEMAMSVGPEKSRRSKQKALASPTAAAAAAAVMSRDDDNGGVQMGQASGARATSSAVSPCSDPRTTWLSLSSTSVTPPSNAVSGAGLSLSREDRAVAVAGGEFEEPVAPAVAAAAGLSREPFGQSALGGGAHDLGGEEGGLRTATGLNDNEAPQAAACGALDTSLESRQRNCTEAAVGGGGGKAHDGSAAVAAGGARDGTQVRATGGGSVVVAAGTVSAASELWGGRSATAKARAADLRDREAAAAVAAAEAATADGCAVKTIYSATANRRGGTGGAVDGTGGRDGRRDNLRSTSSARTQAAAAPPPPLASPVKAKGRVAAMAARVMAGNWGRGGDNAVPVGSGAGAGGTVAGIVGDGVKARDSRLISAKAGRGEGEGRYGGDAAG